MSTRAIAAAEVRTRTNKLLSTGEIEIYNSIILMKIKRPEFCLQMWSHLHEMELTIFKTYI